MYKNLRGEKDVCVEHHSTLFISLSKTCTFKDVDYLNLLEKNGYDVRLKDTLLYSLLYPVIYLLYPGLIIIYDHTLH